MHIYIDPDEFITEMKIGEDGKQGAIYQRRATVEEYRRNKRKRLLEKKQQLEEELSYTEYELKRLGDE